MRNRVLVRWLIVGAVAAAAGVVADRSGWASAAGADVWNLPKLNHELEEYQQTETRLDAVYDSVADRITVKEAVTAELIAGRMTLADATERFERINQDSPESVAVIQLSHPDADPRELAARNVLNFVLAYRYDSPATRSAATDRVVAEFARLFPAADAGTE